MRVLSLFDGMSCAQLALKRAGIKVDTYYASEVDKFAIKITQKNFPNTKQLGDVCGVTARDVGEIDLLIGGSPCQGFSFAGRQLNFQDPRSKLFFEYVRLLRELKPKYFLLENVRMSKKSQDVISEQLGVEPIKINSSLVSAQNRNRLYWTNINFKEIKEDCGLVLRDILEENTAPHFLAGEKLMRGYQGGNQLNPAYKSQANTIHDLGSKSPTICAGTHGYAIGYVPVPHMKKSRDGLILAGKANLNGHDLIKRVYHPDGKSPTLNACLGGHREPKIPVSDGGWRKLTPLECERLQTVPDNYTSGVSNTQRYRMLGNGMTVEVIAHILKQIC